MSSETAPRIHRGLVGVPIGSTKLSNIDGQAGKLFYSGIPIEDLAYGSSYEAVVFLLLYGDYPTPLQLSDFRKLMAKYRELPPAISDIVASCRHANPTTALQVGLSALEEADDPGHPLDELALKIIGATASIICTHHALRNDETVLSPDLTLDHASDFYRRLIRRSPTPLEHDLINLDFVLHADHGANASTTVARVAASARASLSGAISAAFAALCGPKHGGAPAAVAELLDGIDTVAGARALAKDYRDKGLALPGFGHRVYKVQDPRVSLYRSGIERWIESTGSATLASLDLVDGLIEEMKPFLRMGIAPNDDLLAAVLYKVLQIPNDLFTSLFAASRAVGWAAHYMESIANGDDPIPDLFYEDAELASK